MTETQKENIDKMARFYRRASNGGDECIRVIGRTSSLNESMQSLIHYLANWEAKSHTSICGWSGRFAEFVQDKEGNLGAFRIEEMHPGSRVCAIVDLLYTVSKKEDVFEAELLTEDVCRSGRDGDTTRHHGFHLRDIVNGELIYTESVRTEFDFNKAGIPRATKIEDRERSAIIYTPNTAKIEEFLSKQDDKYGHIYGR